MNCKVLVDTKTISNNEWLEYRRQGIGGSDVGAILGFNKYKSAYMVYLEKLGQYEQDLLDKECVYWGNVLEDIVAKEFERRTGKKVRKRNAILQSEQYPFMLANIDRDVVGENAILECKTTNAYLNKDWDGEEVPAGYILQCQHYMAVTGADKTYIACLIGGNRFIWKDIKRDEELISMLIQKETEFWGYVQNKIEPPLTGCDGETEYINKEYPDSSDTYIDITSDMQSIINELIEIQKISKDLDIKMETYKNEIKQAMKDNEKAVSDKYTVSWKTVVSNRVDAKLLKAQGDDIYSRCIKSSKSRRFEIKENK